MTRTKRVNTVTVLVADSSGNVDKATYSFEGITKTDSGILKLVNELIKDDKTAFKVLEKEFSDTTYFMDDEKFFELATVVESEEE